MMFGKQYGDLGGRRNKITDWPDSFGVLDWYRGCLFSHPAAMFRKEVFVRHGLRYDPEYVACEDYELWSRAVRHTKIVNMPDVLLDYRRHDNDTETRQHGMQQSNTRRVRENILSYCFHGKEDRKRYAFFAGGQDKPAYARIRLFGFLPLLTIRTIRSKKEVFLFGLLPLLKIKRGTVYLLLVLPVAKIEYAE